MPGRPMSSSTTSGRNCRARSSAAGAVVGRADLVAQDAQQHGRGSRRRPRCRPPPGRGAVRRLGGSPAGPARRRLRGASAWPAAGGRRTRCPARPRRCWASTVPPCISTSAATSVRPMPRPPWARSQRAGRLGEQLEDAGQHLRGRCRCRCRGRGSTASLAVPLDRQPDASAARVVYLAALFSRFATDLRQPGRVGRRRGSGSRRQR